MLSYPTPSVSRVTDSNFSTNSSTNSTIAFDLLPVPSSSNVAIYVMALTITFLVLIVLFLLYRLQKREQCRCRCHAFPIDHQMTDTETGFDVSSYSLQSSPPSSVDVDAAVDVARSAQEFDNGHRNDACDTISLGSTQPSLSDSEERANGVRRSQPIQSSVNRPCLPQHCIERAYRNARKNIRNNPKYQEEDRQLNLEIDQLYDEMALKLLGERLRKH